MEDQSQTSPGKRQRGYQRTYKACAACRQRKLRCIPDASGYLFGPCSRCKRESRQCFFDPEPADKTKKVRFGPGIEPSRSTGDDASMTHNHSNLHGEDPATGSPVPGERTNPTQTASTMPGDGQLSAGGAAHNSVLLTEVSSENDALEVLFQAVHDQTEQESDSASFQAPHEPVPQLHQETLLETWSQCYLVRRGWLTADEALNYTNFFFRNLAPLSPVLPYKQADGDVHYDLAINRPLLCCTIIMISSRYHTQGSIRSVSRGAVLHEKLWEQCAALIEQIAIGLEPSAFVDDDRTHGNLQALLLMVEWKPRAVHYSDPVSNQPKDSPHTNVSTRHPFASIAHSGRLGGPNSPSMIQPGRVSDNMSWMLLSCALGLVHRRTCTLPHDTTQAEHNSAIRSEGLRLRKLLYIFMEHLSLRLGCEPMITTSLSNSVTASMSQHEIPNEVNHRAVNAWVELTRLLRLVSGILLPNPPKTLPVTIDNHSSSVLSYLKEQLTRWRQTYPLSEDSFSANPETYEIEYQYTRILLHSVGLRAIANRIPARRGSVETQSKLGKLLTTTEDHETVEEVVDGSRRILQIVKDLHDRERLQYIPVRIVLRTITASVFLLKALTLDPLYLNLDMSLDILIGANTAMRNMTVDEMHLGPRYATLIEAHVARFKSTLSTMERRSDVDAPTDGLGVDADQEIDWINFDTQAAGYEDWLSLLWEPSLDYSQLTGGSKVGGGGDDSMTGNTWLGS